ncbi:thiol-disulfide oxidoreductase DCC family protein [Yinghuangia aomiensis]
MKAGSNGSDGSTRTGGTAPVLVYDGDCGFCTKSVEVLERLIGPDVEVVAWQFADLDELGVTAGTGPARSPADHPDRGRAAAPRRSPSSWLSERGPWTLPGAVLQLPGVDKTAAAVYRLIAENRYKPPRRHPRLRPPRGPPPGRPPQLTDRLVHGATDLGADVPTG